MTENKQFEIERRMCSSDFYMCDFPNDKAAANFLGITQTEWTMIMKNVFEESLNSFIYTMRVDEIKDHLARNPRESLRMLAFRYRFRSRLHLLWHFYKREKCTPREWGDRNGLLWSPPQKNDDRQI